ncbi:Putative BTB/POZ domain-containing protein [Septoria linicola]|uniref:BTB/POZ domain-containing protein n=1 Tax=Septoria linicola TaxID=215465 RepID=A0A9Q9EL74_9PEZI|nr:Putative BTB/POZ domain-containing protein [Septoria linicola]
MADTTKKRSAKEDATPLAKRKRFASSFVTAKVGLLAEALTTHETLLKDHTSFFAAALDAKWKEGQTREIKLPEDDPDAVATYFDFLHTKQGTVYWDEEDDKPNFDLLVRVYVFGEKVQDERFCDVVMSALCQARDTPDQQGARYIPGTSVITDLYDGTPAGSPARRWVVDQYRDAVDAEGFREDLQNYPAEFVQEVAMDLKERHQLATRLSVREQREKWFRLKPDA